MTFVDDALPVVRPARPGLAGVKAKQGDGDENAASFQKALDEPGEEKTADARPKATGGATSAGRTAAAAGEGTDTPEPQDMPGQPTKQTPDAGRQSASALLSASLARKAVTAEPKGDASAKAADGALQTARADDALADADAISGPDAGEGDGLPEQPAPAKPGSTTGAGLKSLLMQVDGAARPKAMPNAGLADAVSPKTMPKPGAPATDGSSTTLAEQMDTAVDDREAVTAGAVVTPKAPKRDSGPATVDPTSKPDADPADVEAEPAEQSDVRDIIAILGPHAQTTAAPEAPAKRRDASGNTGQADATTVAAKPAPQGDHKAATAETTAATAAAGDGADEVFRFARATGRAGGTASTRVETDATKTTAADQAAAKAETVTVLDARRYLGVAAAPAAQFSLSANGQSVASAIAGGGDPAQTSLLNAGLSAGQPGATGKVVNTLKIQMHPIELGMVTATLRLRDEELQIDVRVQSSEAYRQLSDDQDAMLKSLRAQGFQVDQINIVFTPGDGDGMRDGASSSQGNQQQAFQNGRDGQSGPASGQSGDQRSGNQGRQRADDGQTSNDPTRETSSAAQPGASDDVYI